METSNVVLYETLHYTICMYVVYVWPCLVSVWPTGVCGERVNHSSSCSRLTVELVQKAEHAGVSWISVHGRTVQQRTEPVSLEAIKLVCVCVCVRAYSFFTYKCVCACVCGSLYVYLFSSPSIPCTVQI